MRLQDLLDDLAEPRWEHHTITTVARRIAALYEPCPDCDGSGWDHPQPAIDGERATCSYCSGTGAREAEMFPTPYGATFGRTRYAMLLARYLFGEG